MLFYAHGGRAPSAKASNDMAFYELCIDTGYTPDEIRRMNIRDRNHLLLVNQGRKYGKRQIANMNKLETTYNLEL